MRLIKAMWPCLKYRNVAKPQRTQKENLGNSHHNLPSQPHPQSYFILLSVAQLSLFLPGEIRPHLLQSGPATLKSNLFLHPNSVFSGKFYGEPTLNQMPTFISQRQGANMAIRSHVPSQFLEQRAEQITQEVPAAATLSVLYCLKHLNDPASLELPRPHWLPVL